MATDNKTVLIYDDDDEILELCTYYLTKKGWIVYTKQRTIKVIDDLGEYDPHIVLMDFRIAGSTSINAIRDIRGKKEFNHIPVVLFTASVNPAELASQIGTDGFIEKPFELKAFEVQLSNSIKTRPARKPD